ncbi:hypothetical protein L6R52_11255, partial [Myxococcota bacterium]|nr:hypothetical protein [Myxococcota bacterium]
SDPAAPPDPNAPLSGPREPPPAARSLSDTPFVQEYNHPLLDADPRKVPITAVVLPPPAIPGFAVPLAIEPRGIRAEDAPPGLALALEDGEADLIAAAASGEQLAVASATTLYVLRSDGAWTSTRAPEGVELRGLVAGRRTIYVLTSRGLVAHPIELDAASLDGPTWAGVVAAAAGRSGFYMATETTLSARGDEPDGGGDVVSWEVPLPPGASRPTVIIPDVTLPEPLELVLSSSTGLAGLHAAEGGAPTWVDVPLFAPDRVPYVGARAGQRLADGGFVVATPEGAMRMIARDLGPEWRAYNADRWIPSKDVRGVAAADDPLGPIWLATGLGLAEITARRITLEEKLAPFVERILLRHDRDGAVADSHLTTRGDLSTNIPWDSDNDGSWTSYWLRGECYRWKVTGDPAAKENFDKALDAMLRLRDVTGTDHFLARAVIRKEGCRLDDCDDPDDGKWFTSPDGEWWVKRDTSNDEVIAHLGMMGQAYDLCADDAQKQRIRDHVGGIVGGIMENGWQLIDPITNAVTTYGQFDPAYVNESIPGIFGDGGVRSLEILAGLTLAHYLTGEVRFLDGKRELMLRHGYDDNAERELEYPVRLQNQDNDEMAVWAWMVIVRYEADPELAERWQRAWQKNWDLKFGFQQAAWWNLVHAYNGGAELELESTLRWLRIAPVDMIRWQVVNTNRRDLVPAGDTFGPGKWMRSDGRIIPYDERPLDRWNTDQFKADGGFDGWIEMDGADILEPYWKARYYGWITAGD